MRKIILFFMVFVYLSAYSQVSDTILFSNHRCTEPLDISDSQSMYLQLENDTLTISGKIISNCCGTHFLKYEIFEDSILLTRIDTGNLCDCYCLQDIVIKIGGCTLSNYNVKLHEYSGNDGIETIVSVNQKEYYKSFIHPGVTKWLYHYPQDACGMVEISSFGDTIINQLTYKVLWRSRNYWIDPPYSNINEQWRENNKLSYKANAFIRQSCDSSKLYLFDGNSNIEYLVADMNLKVGDEFEFPEIGIALVDNVYYNDGLKIIEFNINMYPPGKISFIESIGINREYFEIIRGGYSASLLICYQNNSYFYNYSEYQPCGCVISNTDEVNIDKYKITKQQDIIEVSFNEVALRTWELIDMYGRKIHSSKVVNQPKLLIPITGISKGIYFLRINDINKNESTSLKIAL